VLIIDNINDEDFVNIVDEVFEEMEIDNIIEKIDEIGDESDESDEDHVLSADSDCISDCSDDLMEIIRKVLTNSQLNALNGGTKHCAIYFYYSTGGALAVCASCMIDLVGVELEMYPTRRHVIDTYDAIDGRYCLNYKNPLFLIFSCNMPNVYTVRKHCCEHGMD